MRIFASYNIKGGVGKTASAVNLAYLSARGGARTLLWDLDPQAAATYTFRIRSKIKGGGKRLVRRKLDLDRLIRGTDFERLDLLPADFSYRNMDLALDATKKPVKAFSRLLLPLAEEYDHIFLDCPPSISLVSEAVFVASDVLLVPTIPTPLSLRTLDQLEQHLGERGRKRLQIMPFFCMVDRRKRLHRDIIAEARSGPHDFLDQHVPYSSLVDQMAHRRAPLHIFAGRRDPTLAYEAIWKEVEARVAEYRSMKGVS